MLLRLAENGRLPDSWIRFGMRRSIADRLRVEQERHRDGWPDHRQRMASGPVAAATDRANDQHYEVPAAFFERVLGPHLKYSGCHWPEGTETLAEAEASMLDLTCRRADITDGQRILELGCGWGSLSLWLARHYPASRITAVSNSAPQRRFIERRALDAGIDNLKVVTADMNDFEPDGRFDRVVSVEMFEHMCNQEALLRRIASWLRPEGALFIHIFCHRSVAYFFDEAGRGEWMARHFFTGGMMPAFGLFEALDSPLEVTDSWLLDGDHYRRTAEAWLARLDGHRQEVADALRPVYRSDTAIWVQRWRMFFMACAELFGFADGREWQVGHYRLQPGRERNGCARP